MLLEGPIEFLGSRLCSDRTPGLWGETNMRVEARRYYCGIVLASTMCLGACVVTSGHDMENGGFRETVTTILSREVHVPATVLAPASSQSHRFPLVVMAHGHGGSREEGGGFSRTAEALADRGIASIRIDFSGCGDSIEAFKQNRLTTMAEDVRSARRYALDNLPVDANRIGILGYSMGGRVAMLQSTSRDGYSAMALWAPAGGDLNQTAVGLLGGHGSYQEHRRRAQDAGSVTYVTQWREELTLGAQWFEELDRSKPSQSVTRFAGPILILHGSADDVVQSETIQSILDAIATHTDLEHKELEGAGHDFGFYSNNLAEGDEVIEHTVEFFAKAFKVTNGWGSDSHVSPREQRITHE